MRAVVQRVREASVRVLPVGAGAHGAAPVGATADGEAPEGLSPPEGQLVGSIGPGLLVLVAIAPGDGPAQVDWMAGRLAHLRIFADAAGKMNHSLLDLGLGALVVSQFTLYADCSRGRRPDFFGAAPPGVAEPLYLQLCDRLHSLGVQRVQRGVFGAHMQVQLLNDGPVTLLLDSPP